MDRESINRLKLDQRLIRRRGWISDEDLQRELAELPDSSHNIAPPSEEAGASGGAGEESTPAPDASQTPSPQ